MYPRTPSITLRLAPAAAEYLYYELLGLRAHYQHCGTTLEPSDEHGLLSAITQLEVGIERALAVGQAQLEQLRRAARTAEDA